MTRRFLVRNCFSVHLNRVIVHTAVTVASFFPSHMREEGPSKNSASRPKIVLSRRLVQLKKTIANVIDMNAKIQRFYGNCSY